MLEFCATLYITMIFTLSGMVLESEDPKAEMHFNVLYLENEAKDKLFYPIGGKTPRPPAQQVE